MAEENRAAEDDDDLQIEVEDDTPEGDRGRKPPEDDEKPRRASKEDDDDDSEDDEVEQYSARVQKRIKKLTFDFHEERRQRERIERENQEAIEHAKRMNEELQRLRRQVTDGHGFAYSQAEGRIDAQIKAAQRELRDAYDSGDSEKIVEAQTSLANYAAEKQRLMAYKPQPAPQRSSPEQNQQPQPQRQQPEQPQRIQPQAPSERALEWKAKNEWFDQDDSMTAVAYAAHARAVQNGVQPDSDEYYRHIDREMRKTFPSYFQKEEGSDSVVAAPSRQAGKKPRTVRLNKTQMRYCERLGIKPEDYARELMKLEKNNG